MRPAPLRLRHGALGATVKAHPLSHSHSRHHLSRPLSTIRHTVKTLQRKRLYDWLSGPGAAFRDPLPGSTNYLNAYEYGKLRRARTSPGKDGKDGEMNTAGKKSLPQETAEDLRPFPGNSNFRSQRVLSEEMKQRIFDAVTKQNVTVREASEQHGVDINRVGAVVRLKTMEQEWIKQGKSLATPYARAVLSMLPQTRPGYKHESINDLPQHRATMSQVFWPVSESRQFTRRDAGAAFQTGLLPAEERIPHPQMVRANQHDAADLPTERTARAAALKQEMRERDERAERRKRAPERRAAKNTTLVHAARSDFKFEDVTVTDRTVGKYVQGIGVRYGVPHQDRKKGELKIPRRVG